MTKALKTGYLLRYKRRLFSRYWREEFIVLYEDSSLAWFKDTGRSEPEGELLLKEVPELMAVGQYTLRIPHRPSLPHGCSLKQLMAFGTRNRQKVHWFVAKSEQDVSDWMTMISDTLPLPPEPPLYADIDETTCNVYETIDLQSGNSLYKMVDGRNNSLAKTSQNCCTCIHSTMNGASGSKHSEHVRDNLGEMAAGVMLATGLTSIGWGYGWGWSKPCKSIFGGTSSYLTGNSTSNGHALHNGDIIDPRQPSLWIQNDLPSSGSGHNYYDDYQDNDFDMDFGGDFGF